MGVFSDSGCCYPNRSVWTDGRLSSA
jgi:hypothetical protein